MGVVNRISSTVALGILARLMTAAMMLVASSTYAQQQTRPDQQALIVAFGVFPPYSFFDASGRRTGFSVDLAEAIGEEIGVPIEYTEFENSKDFVLGLVNGSAQIFPGIARLPALTDGVVFSDQIATESLRLMTKTQNPDRAAAAQLTGLRIGIVPPAIGSHIEALRAANTVSEFTTPDAAIMALLGDELDGVLAPNPTLFARARGVGVDNRISFLEPPVRMIERFVALHNSREDLLPAINEAIARLTADGTLAALRAKYFIDLPDPAPEELSVGVPHLPPHWIVEKDGGFSGFNVEVMRDLAARANLQIRFQKVPVPDFLSGPQASQTDLNPGLAATADRRKQMDFSFSFRQGRFTAVVSSDSPQEITNIAELSGQRIGVISASVSERIAGAVDDARIVSITGDGEALLNALLSNEVDAFLFDASSAETLIADHNAQDSVRVVSPALHTIDTAVALRFGLGEARERLDGVIPGYLLSDRFQSLKEKYYGVPVFWTSERVYLLGGVLAAIILVLFGVVIWQRLKQRQLAFRRQQTALEQEQSHNRELGNLVMRLEKANREQAEFTYAISHDLKSPANTISMLIEELKELGELDDGAQTVLADMTSTNHHMRQLVDDVLSYSRLVDEEMTVKQVNLAEVIEEIRKDLASDISNAEATISVADLPEIKGNRTQLRMLLQNLISNAVKFRAADRAPRVEISSRQTTQGVHLVVADNGIGIPEEHRDRVFGLFQRLNAHATYEGTGLGLTICQRIMSNHNGQITIEAGIDGGTAFSMIFPAGAT